MKQKIARWRVGNRLQSLALEYEHLLTLAVRVDRQRVDESLPPLRISAMHDESNIFPVRQQSELVEVDVQGFVERQDLA